MIQEVSFLLPLISAFAVFTLSVIVFLQARKEPLYKIFFLFSLSVTVWLFGSAILSKSCSIKETAIFWDRVIYFAVAIIPASVYHFSSLLTGNRIRWILYAGYLMMFGFFAIIWTDYFASGLNYFSWGCHTQAHVFHTIFLAYFTLFIVLNFYNIIKTYHRATGERKIQLLYVFWALFILATVGSTGFLPAYNIDTFQIAYLSGLITVVIFAYAILKHNLLNIKIIVAEVLTATILLILLIEVFLSKSNNEFIIHILVFIIASFFGFFLIRSVLKEVRARERIENFAEELATANARLSAIDQQKTEFVSIASHQLRSPLTAIKGYSSMLLEGSFGKLSEKTHEAVDRIFQSSQRLVLIVEDFLNVSRIEQGRMKYDFSTFDFKELVSRVVEEQRPTTEKKGLKLTFSAEKLKNYTLMADPGKVSQVVGNFIDNAIKYTPHGSIAAKLSRDNEKMLLTISDTGVGISTETMPKLFDKFSRALDASKVNTGGTGLGLYVAKEIMKAHKGRVWAESPGEGKGSTFFIEFSGDSVK